jgi:hypothetical protein
MPSSFTTIPTLSWQERMFGSITTALDTSFVDALETIWKNCIVDVLKYIPLLLLCYGISLFYIKRKHPKWSSLQQEKVAGAISMYPALFLLIYTSHYTIFIEENQFYGLSSDKINARTYESSSTCDIFANLYIATNIVQAIGQIQTENPPLVYQLMVHHFISVVCYISSFYFDRLRWWATLAGCCEITNLFLIPVVLCKEFFPSWTTHYWYLWNSRLLYVTFVTHRLILFPCWLCLWYYDRWYSTIISFNINDNETTASSTIHLWEGILYPSTIVGLLMLSIIWFTMISHILRKQTMAYKQALKEKTT